MKTKGKITPEVKDENTAEKIKSAARAVFHRKGLAATRTRDIAEEAGINLALLNYYFRSKENLFRIIMAETLHSFFASIAQVINEEETSLKRKCEQVASAYIDLLMKEPQIPMFILSELRNNPESLPAQFDLPRMLMHSAMARQYQAHVASGKIAPMHLMHFLMNLLGLTVFPFIAAPMIQVIGNMNQEQFRQLLLERKTMIPLWVDSMLKVKPNKLLNKKKK